MPAKEKLKNDKSDELDRYAVPKSIRAKIFQFSLAGLFATCGYLYWQIQICNEGWRKDTERFMNEVVKATNKATERVTGDKLQQADNEISKRTNMVTHDIDSLQAQVEALKKQRK